MEIWTEYSRLLTALVVIVDPFMAAPILLTSLILTAIAVEVIANGLRQLFPVLGGAA